MALSRVVRKGLPEELTLAKTTADEGAGGRSGKSAPGRGHSSSKGPEAGVCLGGSRESRVVRLEGRERPPKTSRSLQGLHFPPSDTGGVDPRGSAGGQNQLAFYKHTSECLNLMLFQRRIFCLYEGVKGRSGDPPVPHFEQGSMHYLRYSTLDYKLSFVFGALAHLQGCLCVPRVQKAGRASP